MTTLRAPTHNPTPCHVRRIDTRDGVTRLALAMDTITKAVCWYTLAQLVKVNSRLAIAEIISMGDYNESFKWMVESTNNDYFESRSDYTHQLAVQIREALRDTAPLVVELTPDLAANVNASAGVVIKVVHPTVWHPAMKDAA